MTAKTFNVRRETFDVRRETFDVRRLLTSSHLTSHISHLTRAALLGCVTILMSAACNEPPAVNPWRDDSIPQEVWYTPSYESIMASNAEPATRRRPIPPSTAPAVDESVPHFPLWWEDPFEDQGDNNDTFAWTWQDYFAMPYGEARYILNTIGLPISMIVQPPWVTMVSDGRLEMRGISCHDAKVGHSPNPTAQMSDFGYSEEDPPLPQAASAPSLP